MLCIPWRVIWSDDSLIKINFENFDFGAAGGEKLHYHVGSQSRFNPTSRPPPLDTLFFELLREVWGGVGGSELLKK